ncbi:MULTISPECIES: fasciclin domain-containing protein [Aquimarina]|uniref:Fasciclin domain-containing protein n=1 Tax=Aquimarina algiphila TaxID=2047982 RepID=A0A554VPW5_9FLAO|nr:MULTISPECIES: fasciclin domain-containing protein [Aquimarina]TSE10534.1 fasciclin domain-containing protein [Aquimarina algiphila]
MKKLAFVISTLILFLFVQSLSAQQSNKDIVDVAVSVDDFSTLVTALKAADLVKALKGDGPFTVFAPTNDAFAKIDAKTLNSLLEPANKQKLTSILTYHVVSGKLAAEDVVNALKKGKGKVELTTLSGAKINVIKKDGKIWLKDQNGKYSQIVKTDVMANNGVIHIISDVVMPK